MREIDMQETAQWTVHLWPLWAAAFVVASCTGAIILATMIAVARAGDMG